MGPYVVPRSPARYTGSTGGLSHGGTLLLHRRRVGLGGHHPPYATTFSSSQPNFLANLRDTPTHERRRTPSGSTLAIRLPSKPRRSSVPRRLVGLSPCRTRKATRKKSAPPRPTTLNAPRRAHRRKSDEPCGSRPPDVARRPLPASSGEQSEQRKRP